MNGLRDRDQRLRAVMALMQREQLGEAWALSAHALAEQGEDTELRHMRSEIAYAQGDFPRALEEFRRVHAASPPDWRLDCKLADLLLALRDRVAAAAAAENAAAHAGHDRHGLWQAGKLLNKCGRLPQAHAALLQACAIGQPARELLHDLATTEFFLGRFEQAEAHIAQLLALGDDDDLAGHALYLRSTLRRQHAQHNNIDDLRRRLDHGLQAPVARGAALYALAKELEDVGDEGAFRVLADAATTTRASLDYDIASELDALESLASTFDARWMAQTAAGAGGAGAVFVVGLPRTGTTLFEHLLTEAADIEAAGELLDFPELLQQAARLRAAEHGLASIMQAASRIDFAALGDAYMASARGAVPGAAAFIDKLPVNFQYCGLIHKALPHARIIHLVRDPMASAYAIYRTLFGRAYLFSYDLDELARYYIAYRRLMAHWHRIMPGVIRDVSYEELVADPARVIGETVQWGGLQPRLQQGPPRQRDAVATASSLQVRQPVHARSVDAWKKHAPGLEVFRQRLLSAGLEA